MSFEAIGSVLLLAVTVEALIQVIKGWLPESVTPPAWTWPVVGAALGIGLCILTNADLLRLAGIGMQSPQVGTILTGLLISRGASFVHDLWGSINSRAMGGA